jgi:hypothetical protein
LEEMQVEEVEMMVRLVRLVQPYLVLDAALKNIPAYKIDLMALMMKQTLVVVEEEKLKMVT